MEEFGKPTMVCINHAAPVHSPSVAAPTASHTTIYTVDTADLRRSIYVLAASVAIGFGSLITLILWG